MMLPEYKNVVLLEYKNVVLPEYKNVVLSEYKNLVLPKYKNVVQTKQSTYYSEQIARGTNPPTAYNRSPITATATPPRFIVMGDIGLHSPVSGIIAFCCC